MTAWNTLESRMDAAAFRTFGVDAELQAFGESNPRTVRIILSHDIQRIGEGGYLEVHSEIQVSRDEMEQPAKGDSYTVAGQIWKVDSYEPRPGRWVLVVRRT